MSEDHPAVEAVAEAIEADAAADEKLAEAIEAEADTRAEIRGEEIAAGIEIARIEADAAVAIAQTQSRDDEEWRSILTEKVNLIQNQLVELTAAQAVLILGLTERASSTPEASNPEPPLIPEAPTVLAESAAGQPESPEESASLAGPETYRSRARTI